MRENTWDVMVAAYRTYAEPLSEELSRVLLDRAALPPDAEVLDLCAGTGAVAVPAAEAGHRVRAVDSARAMVDLLAERLAPYGGSAELMDVRDLAFDAGSFDAALSTFGATILGDDVGRVLAEMVRVVRPGGTVGVVHWADPFGAPIFILLDRAIRRAGLGPVPSVTIGYETPEALGAALTRAGWVDATIEVVERDEPLPEPDRALEELEPMYLNHPGFQRLTPDQLERLQEPLAEEVRRALASADDRPPARVSVAVGRAPAARPRGR